MAEIPEKEKKRIKNRSSTEIRLKVGQLMERNEAIGCRWAVNRNRIGWQRSFRIDGHRVIRGCFRAWETLQLRDFGQQVSSFRATPGAAIWQDGDAMVANERQWSNQTETNVILSIPSRNSNSFHFHFSKWPWRVCQWRIAWSNLLNGKNIIAMVGCNWERLAFELRISVMPLIGRNDAGQKRVSIVDSGFVFPFVIRP